LHGALRAPVAQRDARFETRDTEGRERKLYEHAGRVGAPTAHAATQRHALREGDVDTERSSRGLLERGRGANGKVSAINLKSL